MLGLNYLVWIGIVSWIGVPLLALFTARLLWRRSQSDLAKALAMVAGVAIVLTPALISNGVKAYYDRQVRELCANDGGVRVYETVRLPAERFDEFGDVVPRVPAKQNIKANDEYYYEWDVHYYRRGNPEYWRNHFMLIRTVDGKVLGETIGYSRRGGDLPGPWHESSFGCPKDGDISFLEKRVFVGDSN